MRVSHSIQGLLFGPVFIGLVVFLKVLCPAPAGAACFADQLAVPIFLPLILFYDIFGEGLVLVHEFWFIVLYWGFVGLLVGLIFDLRKQKIELK